MTHETMDVELWAGPRDGARLAVRICELSGLPPLELRIPMAPELKASVASETDLTKPVPMYCALYKWERKRGRYRYAGTVVA